MKAPEGAEMWPGREPFMAMAAAMASPLKPLYNII